ncbi:TetR/AcrR family transcriptional regulator [Caldalkalibacillus salinus]|uniref:TetR/AcrR family transcriptional regulator n=1 Tax=Caldalkalibacillus salinus TaxID=2803787 RepID=UPI0019249279|nr:TetR/AcrR family transcriptional regulator [Caldalkalibacillus salinus]
MTRTKSGEKYQLILSAALKVFAENGFYQSQVSKIAKEAGVADGTIYLYFKNKEDLLIQLFAEQLGSLISKSKQKIDNANDAKEALYMICATHFEELERQIDLAYVTQIELRQSSIELRKAIGQTVKPYFKLIETVIRRGINEGIFRANVDPKLYRLLIFGAMDEVVTSWLISGQKYSLSNQVDQTLSFLLEGVST